MNGFIQALRNMGPMRLAAMGGMLVALFAFFAFLMARLSHNDMVLLYGDLELADSGQMLSKLDSSGVPYQVTGGGSQIYVPSDQVGKLRIMMAAEGLPAGGSVGYEIFDKSDGFGTSTFVQNLNHVRALEGEISRTISSMAGVRTARVHIVLGKRELFSRDRHEPSASIFLKMRGQTRLGKQEIAAIQHLVAAAVPNLKANQISIVDNKGSLLARGGEEALQGFGLASMEEARTSFENRLRQNIEDLLEKSMGPGKVWVKVAADLDTERVTAQEEIFDPESKVARSVQTNEESNDSRESDAAGAVTVQQNLPQGADAEGGAGVNQNKSSRTEETTNYEISKTTKNLIREAGSVKKLSVAVLVDGMYTPATEEGKEPNYQPRTADELKQLESLVKTAIGFDENRGDKVEVVNMKFANPDLEEVSGSSLINDFNKNDIMKMAETIALALVGLLVLLLVVKPILNRLFDVLPKAAPQEEGSGDPLAVAAQSAPTALGGASIPELITQPGAAAPQLASSVAQLEAGGDEPQEMIDIKNIDGKIRAASLKKVSEYVESKPEDAANIVRSWLKQDKG